MSKPSAHNIRVRPVAECVSSEVASALTRCFENYLLGTVTINAKNYERRFRAEDLDPFASQVYFRSGQPVGILLIVRRGWTSRLAGMGIVPEQRERGLGKRIVHDAIKQAVSRGDRRMVLEVFEQNAPAISLYKKLGFVTHRRLCGYYKERGRIGYLPTDRPLEVDPLVVARVVACEGDEDLPWMLSAETLSAATLPATAYHLDHRAYALIDDREAQTLSLSTVIVRRSDRRKGWGRRLLQALESNLPGRSWYIPAIVPEGSASTFLGNCGWQRENLSQFEMHLDLTRQGLIST